MQVQKKDDAQTAQEAANPAQQLIKKATQQAQRKTEASSHSIITNLGNGKAKAAKQVEAITEPNSLIRCETLLAMFDELMSALQQQGPALEQHKGIRKGLDLALPMVLQHIDIQKRELAEDPDKLRFAITIIQNCARSIIDAVKQESSNLAKRAGRFDGTANSATAMLARVNEIIANVKRTSQVAKDLEEEDRKNSEVDAAFESRAEARRLEMVKDANDAKPEEVAPTDGNNGVKKEQQPKPLKKPRRTRKTKADGNH